ncbi:hypothetical protein Y032_0286g1387 [Ancylostoma ceylanicum]|uniref:Uncharacterized protein n=1 Tax=Ancylostoma ceylanicum TaxID=53326 RepID=A0A016S603_9BILA|nr:hypothetical protein Y032_0286g1387 [Ancylostoma ceylanicum]
MAILVSAAPVNAIELPPARTPVEEKQQKTAQKTEKSNTTPKKEAVQDKAHDAGPANIMPLPKQPVSPLPAGNDPQKKGCCILI